MIVVVIVTFTNITLAVNQKFVRQSRIEIISDKNNHMKARISNSYITKCIRIFQKCSFYKFLRILYSSQWCLFKTSTRKIAEVTNSHFWTVLIQIGGFSDF